MPAAIAARVAQLSGLAAADSEPAQKAVAAAVSTLVGALKAQPAGDDLCTEQLLRRAVAKTAAAGTTLEDVNAKLAAEEAAYAYTTSWKDKARLAGAVLHLSEQRLALMASSNADSDMRPGDPSRAALQEALHSLALWRSQVQESQRVSPSHHPNYTPPFLLSLHSAACLQKIECKRRFHTQGGCWETSEIPTFSFPLPY